MKLIRLTKDTIIKSFDCGDADLNDFILNDAKAFLSKRIAYTFLIIDGENIVAYFSLLMIKLPKQMQPIILGENLGVVFHTRSISVVILP